MAAIAIDNGVDRIVLRIGVEVGGVVVLLGKEGGVTKGRSLQGIHQGLLDNNLRLIGHNFSINTWLILLTMVKTCLSSN